MKRALLLFSGGQDSTFCLAWALSRYDYIETVGFNYGQRHQVELQARQEVLKGVLELWPEWKEKVGPDHQLDLEALGQISETALTRDIKIGNGQKTARKSGAKTENETLPNTFVPARNLIFLTMSAALAYRRSLSDIIGGMCEADYSGYPDCREATIEAQERALVLGLGRKVSLIMPLMHVTKAESWVRAQELGGEALISLIIEKSHTCYKGERGKRYDWGYGCGDCPACVLREKGFQNWIQKKKLGAR